MIAVRSSTITSSPARTPSSRPQTRPPRPPRRHSLAPERNPTAAQPCPGAEPAPGPVTDPRVSSTTPTVHRLWKTGHLATSALPAQPSAPSVQGASPHHQNLRLHATKPRIPTSTGSHHPQQPAPHGSRPPREATPRRNARTRPLNRPNPAPQQHPNPHHRERTTPRSRASATRRTSAHARRSPAGCQPSEPQRGETRGGSPARPDPEQPTSAPPGDLPARHTRDPERHTPERPSIAPPRKAQQACRWTPSGH